MKKINVQAVPEEPWISPKGKFACFDQGLSLALGREPESLDLAKRHPFDVEICRVPAGMAACPYHSHSAQTEFYLVLEGRGKVRDDAGVHEVEKGDAFIYMPGEAHQLMGGEQVDLKVLIVADNPVGESCHYPDSGKWLVRSPDRAIIRSELLQYFDGEE
jgi:uncharacterized cupin superfamily protein